MSSSDFDFHFEIAEGIGTLTLDRPDSLNSLSFEIYAQLERLFADLERDKSVKVLILTGAGKGFCSGGHVEEIIAQLLERETAETLQFTRMTGAVVRNMRRLNKPVLAAINGTAAGAGAVLGLASDMRIMSEKASFAFLFTKVGLTGADMGAAYLLPPIVGSGRAAEILMLGEKLKAKECLRIGLANRVVGAEDLMTETRSIARSLAEGPGLALSMTKRMLVNERNMDLDSAIEQEAQAQALLLGCADHREFYQAWKEKRDPRFTGR